MTKQSRKNDDGYTYDVTAITATFNSRQTIERCMKSVQEANGPYDIQHVIIDGGSTDGTQDYVQEHMRPHDILVSEPDEGISDAFNKGARLAQGRYLHIMNSDDWADSDLYKILLDGTNNSQESMVHSDAQWWLNGKKYKYAVGTEDYFYEIVTRNRMRYIQHGSMIIRKDVFETVGPYGINIRNIMDLDWLVRASKMGYRSKAVAGGIVNFSIGGTSFGDNTVIEAYELQKRYGVPLRKRVWRKYVGLLRLRYNNWQISRS